MPSKKKRGKRRKFFEASRFNFNGWRFHASTCSRRSIKELEIEIPVCGMIKDEKHRTRGIIFQEKEIFIDFHSEGFKLLTRIQDEVHRFAIEYHRKVREKKIVHSLLDDIPKIGEARKKH